ncbi:MAG: hypothetical protein LDL41_08195 [Coleofasciculus sp. S288]|nr:hypothetical protein [Coleofasciculus sp. S288]
MSGYSAIRFGETCIAGGAELCWSNPPGLSSHFNPPTIDNSIPMQVRNLAKQQAKTARGAIRNIPSPVVPVRD